MRSRLRQDKVAQPPAVGTLVAIAQSIESAPVQQLNHDQID
jgi:hypothetical protein